MNNIFSKITNYLLNNNHYFIFYISTNIQDREYFIRKYRSFLNEKYDKFIDHNGSKYNLIKFTNNSKLITKKDYLSIRGYRVDMFINSDYFRSKDNLSNNYDIVLYNNFNSLPHYHRKKELTIFFRYFVNI